MHSMLQRPAVDSDICRYAYREEPGDVAEEVRRSNLMADPERTPRGTGYSISTIESPPPFHMLATPNYVIGINVGPVFRADMNIAGLKSTASVGTGSMLVMPSGCDAHVAYQGLDVYRFLTLACTSSHLEQAAFSAGLSVPQQGLPPSWNAEPDPQMLAISQAVMAELQSEQCMPMLLETLTLALSVHALRRASGAAIRLPQPSSASGLAPHVVRRVIDYVHAHLQDAISLDTLAEVAGLSTYHFCRMFKQSTGMPPHRYLAQTRISRAKQLLSKTGVPIGDIAFGTGFGSSSQFSHFFKKHAGCTPQEYRRLSK